MFQIIKYPDPILRSENQEVLDPTDNKIKKIVSDMLETMRANEGIGLAAPQIGQNLKICVIEIENEVFVLINPEIKSYYGKEVSAEEGCLSFPGKYLLISRPEKIKVKAFDTTGKKQIIRAKGILARAIQHEVDHLNGVLFVDKINEE